MTLRVMFLHMITGLSDHFNPVIHSTIVGVGMDGTKPPVGDYSQPTY